MTGAVTVVSPGVRGTQRGGQSTQELGLHSKCVLNVGCVSQWHNLCVGHCTGRGRGQTSPTPCPHEDEEGVGRGWLRGEESGALVF